MKAYSFRFVFQTRLRLFFALALLLAGIGAGACRSEDLVLPGGTVYRDFIVTSINQGSVDIWHNSGRITIRSSELPEQVRVALFAELNQILPSTFTLADGHIIAEGKILSIKPDSCLIRHKNGVGLYSFDDFPEDVRVRFPTHANSKGKYRAKAKGEYERALQLDAKNAVEAEEDWSPFSGHGDSAAAFGPVRVSGYYRKDGTYVKAHNRSYPDAVKSNNKSK